MRKTGNSGILKGINSKAVTEMMRKIIKIDEEKCNGCGECIPDCPEGAIQLIEGKARLVSDLFCDGLGACIGTCPQGAITIIEREGEPYNEKIVIENIARQGQAVIKAHLEHLASHGEKDYYNTAVEYLNQNKIQIPVHENSGISDFDKHAAESFSKDQKIQNSSCPGSFERTLKRNEAVSSDEKTSQEKINFAESELRQWPIQLKLLNSSSTFFDSADLLIAADCVSFAYGSFHPQFLKGKILIIFCPKLDSDIKGYIEKLAEIFSTHEIKSITALHMEVPCCNGIRIIIDRALKKAGKTIPIEDITININGSIRD